MECERFSYFPPPKPPPQRATPILSSKRSNPIVGRTRSTSTTPISPSHFNLPTTSKPPSLHPCSNLPRPSQTLVPTPIPASAPQPPPAQTSPSFRPIPGPAGAVQFALHRKSAMLTHPPWHASPLATNDIVSNMEEDDRDFKLDPRLCALRFLGLGPNLAQPVPTCSMKARGGPAERIPQIGVPGLASDMSYQCLSASQGVLRNQSWWRHHSRMCSYSEAGGCILGGPFVVLSECDPEQCGQGYTQGLWTP